MVPGRVPGRFPVCPPMVPSVSCHELIIEKRVVTNYGDIYSIL